MKTNNDRLHRIRRNLAGSLALLLLFALLTACAPAEPAKTTAAAAAETAGAETAAEVTKEAAGDTSAEPETQADDSSLKKVVFALDWLPNTNHSGLFLAVDRGYFAEEGLSVALEQSDMTFIEMVASGKAQLGIASQEQVLQARASQAAVPVVSVAALVQHNTSGFASPKDRKITSPKDFEGKTYSGWGTELELSIIRTLMERDGGDISKVNVISASASDFIAGMETEADFSWIYYGWDGVNADLVEYPINFIRLQDIDPALDFYSPTIITSEALIENDPELIRAFLRAARKGYEAAIAEPDAAVASLLKAAPDLPKNLLEKSQEYLNREYIADADSWGTMSAERWSAFYEWMLANKTLEKEIDVSKAYSLDFLP